MKNLTIKLGILSVFVVWLSSSAIAAEVDHSKMDHSKMGHGMNGPKVAQQKSTKKGSLNLLSAMPPSGRTREAGSDGRYAMEATSTTTRMSEKCAQATRGLIMMDNTTWKRCGGKPKGASMGAAKQSGEKIDHSTMDHSKMDH